MKNKIIYQILAKNLRISEDSINLETDTTNTPEWDSLAHLRIILELEKEFKIKVRNDQIGGLISIKKLIKHFIA
jgi:acyl carrier protein|tara:strand:+ start:548 stop:769 length:222 start_codon:yes stop_codon:yes gene_type:complete